MIYVLIVFLPALAAVLVGLLGRRLGDRASQLLTCLAVTASALLSLVVFFDIALGDGEPQRVQFLTWILSEELRVQWALYVDTLTAVMLVVVNVVSALVHWYSIGYMDHDPHKPRFMAYLSLFTFAMLMLVTADNLVQMFFGWEGVGLASYLLIGFWYEKPSANAAAIKAFIVNRVGDFGFALGIFGIFFVFGAVDFASIFQTAPNVAGKTWTFLGMHLDILTTLTMLLFVGAMGKSAQLFLHTWLPDAMEGPTPVSALIHAATMVTAGVFMVCRLSPVFEYAPDTLAVVTIVGATTAFFAATVGLVQNDIKRIVAYSTCSQLGYMFMAAGLSAYSAAMFHLFTHAFFKALLFLGSGAVIHALHDEQDIRRMGGLWSIMPLTGIMMWAGTLSLAGIPFLSGFYSKDLIVEVAFAGEGLVAQYAFWMALIGVFLTAFYSTRLMWMTFHGPARAEKAVMAHAHEPPLTMGIPLMILTLGAIAVGFFTHDSFTGHDMQEFWRESLLVLGEHDPIEAAHHLPLWFKFVPFALAVAGIALSWYMYIRNPALPRRIAETNWPLYQFLLHKWYFDELYDLVFVRPARWLGRTLWKGGDGRIIDGFGPDGLAAMVGNLARRAGQVQTGYLYHYAFAMLIGIALIVTWFLVAV